MKEKEGIDWGIVLFAFCCGMMAIVIFSLTIASFLGG